VQLATTLKYVTGLRASTSGTDHERASGGWPAVRAAARRQGCLRRTLTSSAFSFKTIDNTGAPPSSPWLTDALHRQVWAVFTRDVPVIGERTPCGIRKLDLEVPWRHDHTRLRRHQQSKVAFNWLVDEDVGLTVRGSWGTSSARGFGEIPLWRTMPSPAESSHDHRGTPQHHLRFRSGVGGLSIEPCATEETSLRNGAANQPGGFPCLAPEHGSQCGLPGFRQSVGTPHRNKDD